MYFQRKIHENLNGFGLLPHKVWCNYIIKNRVGVPERRKTNLQTDSRPWQAEAMKSSITLNYKLQCMHGFLFLSMIFIKFLNSINQILCRNTSKKITNIAKLPKPNRRKVLEINEQFLLRTTFNE